MKRRILTTGLMVSFLLLPVPGLAMQPGDNLHLSSIHQQVWKDLEESYSKRAHGQAAQPKYDFSLFADEWQRTSHVWTGEQVQAPSATALDMIRAKEAWERFGVRGEGMLVSVVDTGINPDHPDMSPPDDKTAAKRKSNSTQKVIPGYNWADRNLVTKDVGESQHGMHVAGIIAADGKLKGVAPEAQLLSQKVFSNYHGEVSGLSESILFAINDSIAKKADVINLSLGSSAGYVDETSGEQYSIKRAVDHGVVVVAAAGNDGHFGSDKVRAENPDVSMVGSPGLAPDAFSVASVNATALSGSSFAVKGAGELKRVVYLTGRAGNDESKDPQTTLFQPHPLVYVGKGKKQDYNFSVKGKIVLIERGDISFEEKLTLAKQAGAAGAIVYNDQEGPFIMSANAVKDFPAVSIMKEAGRELAAAIKQGKKVTVAFDGEFAQNPLPYPLGGTVSSFSSWGPAPDLQFKPEISAPGGGILSTVKAQEYAVKSGTSMATPHVAGAMALMKQAYLKLGRVLEGRDLVETLKAAAMNTALPILDPREIATASTGERKGKYPYSPRVQGAGMIQVDRAIATPVIITNEKMRAGVSLGEIGNSTTFTLILHNRFGKKPITYTVKDEFGVLTDFRRDGINWLTDSSLNGASLTFSATKVTVPPGARQALQVTLQIPKDAPRNIFAEGFIRFDPEEGEVPTLRVPYYGFYGDWDEPRVMDAPMWKDASQEKLTAVKSTWFHDKQNDKWKFRDYLGVVGVDEDGDVTVNPEKISFSPNGDGHFDVAGPSITFLRHARQISIDVVDEKGQVVRSLARDEKVNKFDQSKWGVPYYYTEKKEWIWDGKAYRPDKGSYEKVPDGKYAFLIRAKADGKGSRWQSLLLPVSVDTSPPRLNVETNGNELRWHSKDEDIQGYLLYVNGKKWGGPYSADTRKVTLPPTRGNITLVAYDFAGNMTARSVNGISDQTPPLIKFPYDLFEQIKISRHSSVAVRGEIAGEDMLDRVILMINGKPVPVDADGTFDTVLELPEGLNYVTYSATDVYGNNRQFTQRVIVDKTPPEVLLLNDGTEEVFYDPRTRRMLLPVRVQYRDPTYKGDLRINGQLIAAWEEEQLEPPVFKRFFHVLTIPEGSSTLLLEGRDEAGNVQQVPVKVWADGSTGTIQLQKGEQPITYKAKEAAMPRVGFTASSYEGTRGQTLVVEGRVVSQLQTRLKFWYGKQPVAADVTDRGEFQLVLPLQREGKEKLVVVAVDALGREVKAEATVSVKK